MKAILLILLYVSASCFGQNNEKPDQLIILKDKENKALRDSISKLLKSLEAVSRSDVNNQKALEIERKKNFELKQIIINNNKISLRPVFESKYTSGYFLETDLDINKPLDKFYNSNTLISSVMMDADKQTLDLCLKALAFNKNYMALYEIKKSVLDKKFDEKPVSEALRKIDSLPNLDSNSKLDATKVRIRGQLKNYKENACLLKKMLDKLKPVIDQKAIEPTYTRYERDARFKDYNNLVNVITRMKKDVNSYTSDALPVCEELKSNIPSK